MRLKISNQHAYSLSCDDSVADGIEEYVSLLPEESPTEVASKSPVINTFVLLNWCFE